MDYQKRTLLAVVLTFAFLFAYQYLMSKKYAHKTDEHTKIPDKVEKKAQNTKKEKAGIKIKNPGQIMEASEKPLPSGKGKSKPMLKIQTPLFFMTLDKYTGGVISFRLKKYLTELPPDGVPVELIEEEAEPLPFQTVVFVEQQSLYPSNFTSSKIKKNKDGVISFQTFSRAKFLRFTYNWKLYPDNYKIDVVLKIHNLSKKGKNVAVKFLMGRKFYSSSSSRSFKGLLGLEKGKLIKIKSSELKDGKNFEESIDWIGFTDKYFLTLLIPQKLPGIMARAKSSDSLLQLSIYYPQTFVKKNSEVKVKISAYFGPKKEEELQRADPELKPALNMGIIAGPLLKLLKFFYKFTGNYGLAIIIISLLVKLIFWPLSNLSYKSMKKMKEIQPVLEQLKKKYGDDKEKLSRETMEIYRRYKVNPFSGCLPLIVQLPVFIALYRALLNAIELRHAPFYLWIKDLSAPELLFNLNLKVFVLPVRFLPILMGITTFLQQKLTPSAGADPTQSKLMNYMSLFFVVLFWNFPSGLMLYWVIQNLLSIVQQVMILKNKK